MPATNQPLPTDSPAWAGSLVRPLSRRYLCVLVAVAALVLMDQAILQPQLVQLNFYAPAINLAGRQRMLSQKVTKEVLALAVADATVPRQTQRQTLQQTVNQWTAAHHCLLNGDPALEIPPADQAIAAALHQVEPAFESIRAGALEAAENDVASGDQLAASATVILAQDPIYLRGMESVVAQLEEAAQVRVAWLRRCGLIAMLTVLVLLLAVYFLVLQPAANVIRRQVEQLADSDKQHRLLAEMLREARDQLELRVTERTAELSTSNLALEREMTERQAAELRMRELSAELAQVSRMTALGQLATGLAHEINQPLATVANYAGTLELTLERGAPHDQESQRLVAQIKQAALRAGAIVRRMRNFVRTGDVQTTQVELNDLVREVSELCQPEMQQTNVHLTLQLDSQSILIQADALQVQQVLVNLIQNAIQAIVAAASRDRHLRICTEAGLNEVRVTVADSGPGFPGGSAERCFDSFFSTKPEGLGMGLAICRTIIQQHQGTIWCENQETGGALVGFSLPLLHAYDSNTDKLAHRVCG